MRKPLWDKYMKTDFIHLRVSQPGDRKKEERKDRIYTTF